MSYFLDSESNVRWFNPEDDKSWWDGMRPLTESEALELVEQSLKKPLAASCTPAQGLIALYTIKGISEANVLEALSLIEDPEKKYIAQIGYTHSKTWERNSPTMETMAELLNLSEEDLEELFAYASTVVV